FAFRVGVEAGDGADQRDTEGKTPIEGEYRRGHRANVGRFLAESARDSEFAHLRAHRFYVLQGDGVAFRRRRQLPLDKRRGRRFRQIGEKDSLAKRTASTLPSAATPS